MTETSFQSEDDNLPVAANPSALHRGGAAQVDCTARSVQAEVATGQHLPSEFADAQPQLAGFEPGFQPLDPRFIAAERTASWIFFAFVAVGGAVAQVAYIAFNWPLNQTALLIAIACGVGYVLLLAFLTWAGHFYPAQAYRHAAWRLSDQGLDIRRGVWWKHEITVPRARVQHSDIHQGPLMRKFGLARLVVNTAGTQNASIALDGLALPTAQRLRSELVAQCNSDAEGVAGR